MGDKGKCQICPKLSESRCSWCRLVFYCCKDHQKQDWAHHKQSCTKKKYRIEENEKLGRHVVAIEDIKPDYILFKDKPLALGFKVDGLDSINSICLGCYKDIKEKSNDDIERQCGRCRLPICSEECGSQYFHENFECKFLREASQNKDAGAAKVELEPELKESILHNLLHLRCILLKHVNEKYWEEMLSLQSHIELREDVSSLEKTARIYNELKKILSKVCHTKISSIHKPDLHKILGILHTNAVDVRVSANVEITALFPLFCIMEHSCVPTTKYYFVNSGKKSPYELFCRSSIKIKKGEHLTTMYTNILWNTEKRREHLKKSKYFWCTCPRCSDPYELGSNFSTLLCPLQGCKSLSVPVPKSPDTPEELHWQCTSLKCGKICEPWQVKKVDSKLSEMVAKMLPTATNYKEMLSKIEELVHPDYYLNFVVNHSLVQMYGRDDNTRNDKEILEDKLNRCNRLLASMKKLDPSLARCNIYAAVVYFEMHSAILALAGGEGDEDFKILRKNPETVKLGKVYLQKCIDCFLYEFLDVPENKLKILAMKKLEYLNMIMSHR